MPHGLQTDVFCIFTVGTILRDDGYFIEPIELVQLLLTNFIQMLNPDLFPKDDRPSKIILINI